MCIYKITNLQDSALSPRYTEPKLNGGVTKGSCIRRHRHNMHCFPSISSPSQNFHTEKANTAKYVVAVLKEA